MAFIADETVCAEQRAAESLKICDKIAQTLQLCGNVLCFMPLGDEVDIRPVFDVIRSRGGCVILPYCVDDENMILKRYDEGAALVQDAKRVLAPLDGEEVPPNTIDEALIPAVALTASGKRLGRGGGFYDRLIPNLRQTTTKAGICFHHRIAEELPTEQHDALVDMVISCD
ncbi:MAG: 5-formyltetrahydrofolate cyclo-ligase [Clostridia bacterium]|nr:5-formyltetrahydrofolate cyclo-ligase [Clostridia bacterium]